MEAGILGQRLLAVAHAVALDVGLGRDVDAVFVAEVIPAGVVGIVAGAVGIHVKLLHHLDVLNHAFYAYHIAAVGVEFVAVGTLDEHRHAVDEELLVFDFNLAEAHTLRYALHHLAAVEQRGIELVEIRCLGRPLLRILHVEGGFCLVVLAQCHGGFCRDVSASILQHQFHGLSCGSLALQLHVQCAVLVVVHQVGGDVDVVDMTGRTGIEIDLAGNSAQAPEVLILVPRTVAPAHYLHGYQVLFAWLHIFGDVELGCYFRVFAIAHILAVHIEHHVAGGRADMEIHLLPLPVSRQGERLAI